MCGKNGFCNLTPAFIEANARRVCACDDHHDFATTDSLQTICDDDPQLCT